MIDVNFDNTNLWGLMGALKMRDRIRLFKGALHRSANELKNEAARILMSEVNVRDRSAMRKTIWTKVYTHTAGFRVSVAGNNHLYPSRMRNRKGGVRMLPLGRWLETGTTENRETGKGYFRGQLPSIGFLAKAQANIGDRVNENLRANIVTVMTREAKKYGCL